MKKDNKRYLLRNSLTWQKFPITISQELAERVGSKCRRKHKWQKIRFVLSVCFSEIADRMKKNIFDTVWGFGTIGYIKCTVYQKICKLNEPAIIKHNCKRVKFFFKNPFKTRALRILNNEDEKVIKYLNVKKWNRKELLQHIGKAKEWHMTKK